MPHKLNLLRQYIAREVSLFLWGSQAWTMILFCLLFSIVMSATHHWQYCIRSFSRTVICNHKLLTPALWQLQHILWCKQSVLTALLISVVVWSPRRSSPQVVPTGPHVVSKWSPLWALFTKNNTSYVRKYSTYCPSAVLYPVKCEVDSNFWYQNYDVNIAQIWQKRLGRTFVPHRLCRKGCDLGSVYISAKLLKLA